MATKVAISTFVQELEAALKRKDGYIMGSYGQNPKTGSLDLSVTKESSSWKTTGWYYTQYDSSDYSAAQKKKALYWREHATRVWDCNGLAEGIYQLHTGVNINSKARYNYAQWCEPKGSGMIPVAKRVPGAAVFWGTSAANIHHVAYLWKPVTAGKPEGDWYLIEAKGVAYGVVQSKLNTRKPNYWGWMTKYYDYSGTTATEPVAESPVEDGVIRKGQTGDKVKEIQEALLKAGEVLPKYGADGDFGSETLAAVKSFQKKNGLPETGEVDGATKGLLLGSIAPKKKVVQIVGGNCNIRTGPSTMYPSVGVAHKLDQYEYGGETQNLWNSIIYKNEKRWVSYKYSKILD